MLIKAKKLKQFVSLILKKGGSHTSEAEIVSENLVRANLMGHDSHGVGMLPIYFKMLKDGLLKPNQKPEIIKDEDSVLMFDGHRGYGQSVGKIAMDKAIQKCNDSGLVLMTLRNTHHLGRIGSYSEQSISAGKISLHFVNVVDHAPLVTPFGGSDARFSTNPICMAMPSIKNQSSFLLDMATSNIALGKARVAINKKEDLKEGLLIDHLDRPSKNPHVLAGYIFPENHDTPPLGALTTIGEYKGYGLALFCEFLGGILRGGRTIQPNNKRKKSIINNMFSLIIDPSRLI